MRIAPFILSLYLAVLLFTCSEDPSSVSEENYIWFVSPKGGETFLKGDIVFIKWDFRGSNVKLIKLFYSIDSGNNWVTISDSIPAIQKEYAWTVLVQGTNSLRFRISTTKLFCETGNIVVDDSFSQGIITGVLKGNGRLVPNRKYGGLQVDLLQNGNTIYKDTTNEMGQFTFTGLWPETYQLNAIVDFGNENIAYANDIYILTDTILVKDLLLDSVKYDFCQLHVGNEYKILGKFQSDISYREDIINIIITDSSSYVDSIYYYFDAVAFAATDTIEFTGYFNDSNSQIRCITSGCWGCWPARLLSLQFRAVHIYDGSDEMNDFLKIRNNERLTIYYGEPLVVNNQSFSTLSIYKYFISTNETIKYNFSPELGLVYAAYGIAIPNYYHEGWSITLVDYNF